MPESAARPPSALLDDARPHTVALLQFTGIGDLIWHIQYFRCLAQTSRGGKVTIVAQPSTLARAFIGHEPWVEDIIDHDHRPRRGEKRRGKHAGLSGMWRMGRLLHSKAFDRIVLFSGRPSRGLIAAFSGIPQRLGYGYNPLQRIFLTQGPYIPAYRGEASAVYPEASAFMMAHGFCDAPIVPRLEPPASELAAMQIRLADLPRPLATFTIGTSESYKQWGADNFAELATRLVRDGWGVLLLGGPGEAALAADITNRVDLASRSKVATVTNASVLGSAAALRLSDVCVGNDTGMINVAAAVGRPSYVLIGARAHLDQDPELMRNVRASSLAAVSVDQVHDLLRPHRDEAVKLFNSERH